MIEKEISFSYSDLRKDITLPKDYSSNLAEFIGIMIGDGYFVCGSYKNIIEIGCSYTVDYRYITKYIKNLIKKLFNVNPNIYQYKERDIILISIYSKAISNFLKNVGLKSGRKDFITVPEWILENEEYSKSFLRGLFDTDGSFALKKRYRDFAYYPVISFSSKNKELVLAVQDIINRSSISYYSGKENQYDNRTNKTYTKYRIELNGHRKFLKWVRLIGTSNPKNYKKYEIWKQIKNTWSSLMNC